MERFGDPGFLYHATAARIGAAMVLRMADADILPYDYVEFARTMRGYVPALSRTLTAKGWDASIVAPLPAATGLIVPEMVQVGCPPVMAGSTSQMVRL